MVHVSYGVTWAILEFPSESVAKAATPFFELDECLHVKLLPHVKPMTLRAGTTTGCEKGSRGGLASTHAHHHHKHIYDEVVYSTKCQVRCPAFQVTQSAPHASAIQVNKKQHSVPH